MYDFSEVGKGLENYGIFYKIIILIKSISNEI